MTKKDVGTLLVTGASGHLGRRVVELLLEAHVGPIVATTRKPEALADLERRGVTVRRAEFDEPARLERAFRGAKRMLLVSTDASGPNGRRVEQHANAIQATVEAGVHHVVYTSCAAPELESPVKSARDHRATESALLESGLGWTLLRNNLYAENLLGSLPHAIASGRLVAAAGDGAAGYVTREDCAHVAAAALAARSLVGMTYEITGPAAVSHAELAGLAGRLTGRAIDYIAVAPTTLRHSLVQSGVPQGIADDVVSLDEGIALGAFEGTSHAVKELTGRPPARVEDFLLANRDLLQTRVPAQ